MNPLFPASAPLRPIVVDARQACQLLSISRRSLFELTEPKGPIPAIRQSRKLIRYRVADLEAWAAGAVEASPKGGAR